MKSDGRNNIQLQGVSVSFFNQKGLFRKETQVVIDKLSFSLQSGEIVALVGESGCGKSVLAKTIMGILPKNASFEGKLTVGEDLVNQKQIFSFAKEHFIYLPQSVNCLNPLLTMEEQIPMIDTNLGKLIPQYYPFQCSGGMLKQSIFSVAQEKPEALVLIADEPTMGMDTETALENLSFLKEFAKTGMAVLCITHDLDLAFQVADKVAVFSQKNVVEVVDIGHHSGFSPENLKHSFSLALYHALPQYGFTSMEKGGE